MSRWLTLVGLFLATVAVSSTARGQNEPPDLAELTAEAEEKIFGTAPEEFVEGTAPEELVEGTAPEEFVEEPKGELISMNFQDVDLPVLVRFISDISGRNFIIDEKVKGKITIISPSKITVDEAYNVFRSVLQVKGFTTVPSGSVIKILPVQEAKSATLETILPGFPQGVNDEYITRLMKLDHVEATNLMPIVQPLVSGNGLLASYTPTNTLIIIDSAANIDRVARIIDELDIEGVRSGVEVIRLNYAFATEIAGLLVQVLEEPEQASATVGSGLTPSRSSSSRSRRSSRTPPTAPAASPAAIGEGGSGEAAYKIIPDERTNTLIVVAGQVQMRRIKALISRLDVPLPLGTGRIHVYYLKYASAFEIVPVLSDLIGGGGTGGFTSGLVGRAVTGSTAFRGGRLGQQGGVFERTRRGGYGTGDSFGGGIGGFGSGLSSRGQSFGGGSFGSLGGGLSGYGGSGGFGGGTGVASAAGGGGGQFEGEVRITADPSTNALIIYASPQDFETLKRVIELLDVRRRQVFVEAIIMEVGVSHTLDLGIELQGATSTSNGVGIGRVNFGTINDAILNPASIQGLLAAAASNQTIRLPDGTVVPAQVAMLHAAQSDNDVNLLSAPTILTTDNQEAEIVVGRNVPFIASRSTSETNLSNTFATVDRRDVGITLRLTPQISEGGMVRLDIFEEVSRVVEESVGGLDPNLVGPTTTIRSATTSVVVRDGQTVVIGGLIADGTTHAVAKVPFIGDLPVLGHFFRSNSGDREKRNLLLFLTPHIIRTAAEQRDLSLRKRDQVKAFMDEQKFRNRQTDFLDRPSWAPELPAEDEDSEKDDIVSDVETDLEMQLETLEPQAMAPRPDDFNGVQRPAEFAEGEQAPPVPSFNRYVLLAGFAERGTPPEGLKSSSGLIALSLPAESELTGLFRKGGGYRFHTDSFEGLYFCLEAFATPREALLIYPEGLMVDPGQGEYLHWRDLQDAMSANVVSWTELN